MKKLSFFLCTLIFATFVWAQTENTDVDNEPYTVRVGILNGPSCIPCAYMMENAKSYEDTNLSFETFATPQALLPKMIKNEIDIGFMPINVAAKVYNSTNKAIICAGVCGNGNLALITKNKNAQKIEDLAGATVSVAGQGAMPEYIFTYILSQYDLNQKIELDYTIPTGNIPAALISNKIEYAVVPEPFATIATTKDNSVVYAIDLQKEYSALSGNNIYPFTCIVVRAKYAKENPDAVKNFLEKYEASVDWTIDNPGIAGQYCEKNNLGLAAPIVRKSIPKSNFVYVSAENSIKEIEDVLKVFLKNNSESIGGKLPDKDFYLK